MKLSYMYCARHIANLSWQEDICNVIFLGYQDLTNKLLRNINEKLAEELALVSDKLGRLEKVMGISEDEEESDVEGEEEVCLLT